MRCRYCFREGEWRVELYAYACDKDYNYPRVDLHIAWVEEQLVKAGNPYRERSITK